MHPLGQGLAGQITGILPVLVNGGGGFRVAHPEAGAVAVLGQDAGRGGAETATAENRGGVFALLHQEPLFSGGWVTKGGIISASTRPGNAPGPVVQDWPARSCNSRFRRRAVAAGSEGN